MSLGFLAPIVGSIAGGLLGGSDDGGGTQHQTTTNVPWIGDQEALLTRNEIINGLYQTPRQFFQGQTFAPIGTLDQAAQQGLLAYGQGVAPGLTDVSLTAYQSMLNAPDISANPYLQGQFDTLDRQAARQLNESLLRQGTHSAIGAGQLGGSKDAITQGVIERGMNDSVLAAKNDLIQNAYNRGMTAQERALSLGPQVQQMGLFPSQVTGMVGDFYRDEQQKGIDQAMAEHEFSQNDIWERLMMGSQAQSGTGNFGTSSTVGGGSGGNQMAGILGGAMAGSQAGSWIGDNWGDWFGSNQSPWNPQSVNQAAQHGVWNTSPASTWSLT